MFKNDAGIHSQGMHSKHDEGIHSQDQERHIVIY